MSECGGKCCVAFCLGPGHTLEEFRAEHEKYIDGPYILDMVVPLTRLEAEQRAAKFDVDLGDVDVPRFTCKHFDEKTMRCGAYEARPDMCRRYPYERGCEHGCDCVGKAHANPDTP